MKERVARLKAIKKLITSYRIESQEALLGLLQKEGFSVTQATLSRDLKMLKVAKVADGHAGYVYTVPSDEERKEAERTYVQDFLRGYISIDWSLNMVVIKTWPGHTDPVAIAVDNLCLDEVLGTIAGGDTNVFVCLKEGVTGEDFLKILKEKMPEIED